VKPVGDGFVPGVAHPEYVRDRGCHQIGLGDRGEVDKPNAIREIISHVSCTLESEVCLADSAWASQGEQPDIILLEDVTDSRQLPLASDKPRKADW